MGFINHSWSCNPVLFFAALAALLACPMDQDLDVSRGWGVIDVENGDPRGDHICQLSWLARFRSSGMSKVESRICAPVKAKLRLCECLDRISVKSMGSGLGLWHGSQTCTTIFERSSLAFSCKGPVYDSTHFPRPQALAAMGVDPLSEENNLYTRYHASNRDASGCNTGDTASDAVLRSILLGAMPMQLAHVRKSVF